MKEKYIEKKLDRGDVFVPNAGCGDPKEIEINERISFCPISTSTIWLRDTGPTFIKIKNRENNSLLRELEKVMLENCKTFYVFLNVSLINSKQFRCQFPQ